MTRLRLSIADRAVIEALAKFSGQCPNLATLALTMNARRDELAEVVTRLRWHGFIEFDVLQLHPSARRDAMLAKTPAGSSARPIGPSATSDSPASAPASVSPLGAKAERRFAKAAAPRQRPASASPPTKSISVAARPSTGDQAGQERMALGERVSRDLPAPKPLPTSHPRPALPRSLTGPNWIARYQGRVQEAKAFLEKRGYAVVRASRDALIPGWFVSSYSGQFDNDQLVRLAEERVLETVSA